MNIFNLGMSLELDKYPTYTYTHLDHQTPESSFGKSQAEDVLESNHARQTKVPKKDVCRTS